MITTADGALRVPIANGLGYRGVAAIAGPVFLMRRTRRSSCPSGWSVTFTDQGYGVLKREQARVRRQITEYLEIDLDSEQLALCRLRPATSADARAQLQARVPGAGSATRSEIHRPIVDGRLHVRSRIREWCRILEFICPGCATLIEVEYLPPGHPVTHDIELDIDALKQHGQAAGEQP